MDNHQPLPFSIQPSSGIPIYRQLIDQITRLVVSGRLKPGDEIPSVRQVAVELEVNPMTVSKAYSLLETTGILERLRGIGMIVSSYYDDGGANLEKRLELIRPVMVEAAAQAKQLGIPSEKILKMFKGVLEENK